MFRNRIPPADPGARRAHFERLAAHHARRAHAFADSGHVLEADSNMARAAHFAAMAATQPERIAQ